MSLNLNIRKHYPLVVGLITLWGTIAVLLYFSLTHNGAILVYGLDDAFIHMAIAKNFALHGVWGIDRYAFTSSSSSPLWTLILAAVYLFFGVNNATPFVMNVILGTLLLYTGYFILRRFKANPLLIAFILLAIIFFTPLPTLVFCGQEHILHSLLTLLFVFTSARLLSQDDATTKGLVSILILAALLTSVRYEGMFLVFVVSVLFCFRRRWKMSLSLLAAAGFPVVIYGMISTWMGWEFLPTPILLKGTMPSFSSLIGIINSLGFTGLKQIIGNTHILSLYLGACIVFIPKYRNEKKLWDDSIIAAIIFTFTCFLHMQFAGVGWFFRYDAYLVTLGILVIGLGISNRFSTGLALRYDAHRIRIRVWSALVVCILLLPFFVRMTQALMKTCQATSNIYEQQYQMGLFLKGFYQGRAIAANDIGGINYLADIRCVDLWGLANRDVERLRRNAAYDTKAIISLARKDSVEIAIVYDSWFTTIGGVPREWTKLGEWTIQNNVVCGGPTVSFYAVIPTESADLGKNLRTFSTTLPKDVLQILKY